MAVGEIDIEALPREIMEILADLTGTVEWSAASSVDVMEHHPDGRPAVAAWSESYGPIRDTFVLSYEWEGDSEVRWRLLEGRVLKKEDGRYRLTAIGGEATRVELELTLGIGVWVLPILRTGIEAMIVGNTLKALKRRAESDS
ncbi:SRPBCC family protein [soil metagenome]